MSYPQTSILSCFDRIIGIKGLCANVESTSGLNANDIEINSDFIGEIITRQYSGPTDFHTKKLEFAVKKVLNEVKAYLLPNFRITTLLDDARLGIYQDNLQMIAGDGTLKGININLESCQSYLDLFVSEISLQVNYDGDVEVGVYDLIQNKLLSTITVACVANEISRAFPLLNFKSEARKLNLLFAYDSTDISANTTYLNKNGCSGCGSKKYTLNNPYETVSGVSVEKADAKIKSSLTQIKETGGMSIVHSLSCNHDSWVCSYSNLMSMAILYAYGIEVMEFASYVSGNDRINTTLNIGSEEIKERLDIYRSRYNAAMKNVLENIRTPKDSTCFLCRENVRHVISL